MEKHSIESLDQFVHSMIHPSVLRLATSEQVNAHTTHLLELKDSFRKQLLHDILACKSEQETGLLIEHNLIIITNILNLLYNYQHAETNTAEQKQFYKQVNEQLTYIIPFIKNTFGRFFNEDLNLPLSCRLREVNEIKRQWKIITKTMSGSEINAREMTMLDQSVRALLNINEEIPLTYRQIFYFKNLLKDILCYSTAHSMFASLTELLICWSFNELTFIQEVYNKLRTELNEKESDQLRIEFLRSYIKKINQLPEKNNVSYNISQPTVKKILLEWIFQELAYLESTADFSEIKDVQDDAKLHTSLSVPVLALFTRLFKDSGIFTNSNQTEILMFMSTHFTTQRKLEVSYGHLKSKYYQIDEGTKKKVYDHLMEMALRCKKL